MAARGGKQHKNEQGGGRLYPYHYFSLRTRADRMDSCTFTEEDKFDTGTKSNRQSHTRLHKQAHRDKIQQIIGVPTFNFDPIIRKGGEIGSRFRSVLSER